MTVIERAPAKVNLTLHVTGQRGDGYHLLDSLVVFASVGDEVRVDAATSEESFTLTGPQGAELAGEGDNLCLRALRVFQAAQDVPPVALTLRKSLPVASGLGGGSADAAAVLRALTRMTGVAEGSSVRARDARPGASVAVPTAESLADCIARTTGVSLEAALSLGADVPVCVASAAGRMQGIGEQFTPLTLPVLNAVLVNPGVGVSTPAVFKALARKDNPPMEALPIGADIRGFTDWLARQRNDLEPPARAQVPEIGLCLDALRDAGAGLARMSGSGASCFGLFGTAEDAQTAAQALRAAHPRWWVEACTLS